MAANGNLDTDELIAIINGIRDRVRAQFPQGSAGSLNVRLPDLMPVVHARDAAEAKVAAIGTVNPRAPGAVNAIIQAIKRVIARALDWHVREQVEFNRAAMSCIEALLAALNESNRALGAMAAEIEKLHPEEVRDLRGHWIEWRLEWERRLASNEARFLRSLAELQAAFQHRAIVTEGNLGELVKSQQAAFTERATASEAAMRELTGTSEASFRESMKAQHAEFNMALERSATEIQKKLWTDLGKVRLEYERLIHSELRVLRQRAQVQQPSTTIAPQQERVAHAFDYQRFADRFRGSEEYVKQSQSFYRTFFEGKRSVLDIGCGRGEFLELMREMGVPARGIDLDAEAVAVCQSKRLEAFEADLFEYLKSGSFDGIFCAQVVEHLPPERIPEMIRLAAGSLQTGGVLAIETPNPECLAIFATHFYFDPTHTRPIPPGLLVFYFEEAGFGGIKIHRLSPAEESIPSVATLPKDFREAFFGGLDYAIIAHKL